MTHLVLWIFLCKLTILRRLFSKYYFNSGIRCLTSSDSTMYCYDLQQEYRNARWYRFDTQVPIGFLVTRRLSAVVENGRIRRRYDT